MSSSWQLVLVLGVSFGLAGCGPGVLSPKIGDESSTSSDGATSVDHDAEESGDGDGDGDGDDNGDGDGDGDDGGALDVFDPDEVYIAGTLSEGACFLDAMAHWSTPNDAATGFDCYFGDADAIIRPSDGRMIYTNIFENLLREFHCDECPFSGVSPFVSQYPESPLSNDTILPTPACDPERLGSSLLEFRVAPTSEYLYRCGAGWLNLAGEVVYDLSSGPLVHLGYDGLGLTQEAILDLDAGTAAPFVGFTSMELIQTARADPSGGFWFVVGPPALPVLWHVRVGGHVTELGTYPPLPEGQFGAYDYALLPGGELFQQAINFTDPFDVIYRRELGVPAELVYTEADDPLVRLHSSSLVTGP
jgi:hypothetical protein